MKNLATLLYEIDYNSNPHDIISKLPFLGEKINDTIQRIAQCHNLEEAELYIALLERVSNLISNLKFNRNIEIWGTLWEVARRLERIDAEFPQKIIFEEIKEGTFPLIDKDNLL